MKNKHYYETLERCKDYSVPLLNVELIFYTILKLFDTKSFAFFISLALYLPLFFILPFTLSMVVMCAVFHFFSWHIQIKYTVNEEDRDNRIIPTINALKDLKKSKKSG